MMTTVYLLLEACAAVFLLLRFLFMMLMRVKGSSMQPTLHTGQWMLVRRTRHMQRGDVIICHYPNRYLHHCRFLRQYFVKRLIGLPGDTITVHENHVIVNGMLLSEPYIQPSRFVIPGSHKEWHLGPDEYFVLGDNRGASNDSRRVGPITRPMLIGRVIYPVLRREAGLSPWTDPRIQSQVLTDVNDS